MPPRDIYSKRMTVSLYFPFDPRCRPGIGGQADMLELVAKFSPYALSYSLSLHAIGTVLAVCRESDVYFLSVSIRWIQSAFIR